MALCTLLVVRSAAWRGPVVVDGATVSWLLPQPVARGPCCCRTSRRRRPSADSSGPWAAGRSGTSWPRRPARPGRRRRRRAPGRGWARR
ncbi:hypothetical protein ACFQ60_05550 [Streptomyces zhihengii]